MRKLSLISILILTVFFFAPICQPPEEDLDQDGFTPGQGDCNDNDSEVFPGAYEWCDEKDNDCNGKVDDNECEEQGDPTLDMDQDEDGFTPKQGDCDDLNRGVNPSAKERCDGIDNNCSGKVDDSPTCSHPNDYDWDGVAPNQGDCNDYDTTMKPDFPEICNDYKDNNCNGQIDEGDCIVDNYKARFYVAGYNWHIIGCSGFCAYGLDFWLDVKIKDVAYHKNVWIEVADNDNFRNAKRYDLTYEGDLTDGFQRWGVDIRSLCDRWGSGSGYQGTCVDNLYRYKIYYKVEGETYQDDNYQQGFPINAEFFGDK